MTGRLLLIAALLCAIEPAAAAELPLGPPFYREAIGAQEDASIATDGDGYFIVWRDTRSGSAYDLFGTRMSAGGALLDPVNLPLVRRLAGSIGRPRVVWSGTSYVVFWMTHVHGGRPAIWALRVDREGRAQGPARVIAHNAYASSAPFVAGNGSRIVVVYSATSQQFAAMRAVILDPDATVIADVLLAAVGKDASPTVATNGTEFVAMWSTARTLEAMRLSASGTLLDSSPRAIGSGESPIVGSDGTGYLVLSYGESVWSSRTASADLGTVSTRQTIHQGALEAAAPLWTGSEYAVFASRSTTGSPELVRYSVGRDGRPAVPAVEDRLDANIAVRPDAATNGSSIVRVWNEAPSYSHRIVSRVSAASAVASNESVRRTITFSASAQTGPAIAHGAGVELVAWLEDTQLFATRISPDGRLLDGRGKLLDSQAYSGPAVAFDGRQFIVAWGSEDRIRVRAISAAAGPSPITQSFEVLPFALTSGGDGALLVRIDGGTVHATMLDRDFPGVAAASAIVFENDCACKLTSPDVAWNGREFLISWLEYEGGPWSTHFSPYLWKRVRGVRLNAAMTLLDTEPLLLGDAPGDFDHAPIVASDGKGWLVVWGSQNDMRTRRISSAGIPRGDPAGVVIGRGRATQVLWNGERYLFAWTAGGSAHVGSLLPDDSPEIAMTQPESHRISFAPAQAGRLAVAYSRVAMEPEYGGVPRAFIQWLGPPSRRRAVR